MVLLGLHAMSLSSKRLGLKGHEENMKKIWIGQVISSRANKVIFGKINFQVHEPELQVQLRASSPSLKTKVSRRTRSWLYKLKHNPALDIYIIILSLNYFSLSSFHIFYFFKLKPTPSFPKIPPPLPCKHLVGAAPILAGKAASAFLYNSLV